MTETVATRELAAASSELGRPIRVVVFGGAFFEPYALEFLARLEEHEEIDVVGGVCQSPGFELRHRIGDVVRRRGAMAAPVLAVYLGEHVLRFLRGPRAELRLRRRVRSVLARVATVPRVHAQDVLEHVRSLRPDLGLIYGSPILEPQLFEIPRLGTLGIHHGKLPEYRGKKTVFWAMFNGERSAGVSIQKVNAGLDTGAVLRAGEVTIEGKRYGRVDSEVQRLGVELYVQAILSVKRGVAVFHPQPTSAGPMYRQPRPTDIVRLWARQLFGRGRLG
jgi:methionyl-tRNA formyltransferase